MVPTYYLKIRLELWRREGGTEAKTVDSLGLNRCSSKSGESNATRGHWPDDQKRQSCTEKPGDLQSIPSHMRQSSYRYTCVKKITKAGKEPSEKNQKKLLLTQDWK